MSAPKFSNLEICDHGIIKECCAACREAEQVGSVLSFDDEVRVMKHLLAQIGPDEAANFVVRLQRCVDGQLRNIGAYQREFRRLLENRTKK